MKWTLTYLVLISVAVACAAPKSETANQVPDSSQTDSAQLAAAKSASEPLKIQLFNDVAQTQRKLNAVGIGTMKNWHYDGSGWSSASPYYPLGSPGTDKLRNNLTLYIESSRQHEVQTMKVKIELPNMNQKSRGLSQYVSTVKKAFNALGEPIPEDLTSALWKGKPYKKETPTMSIENRPGGGKYVSWLLIVSSY